jgi:UDP-glucuronate 4-epimerase
VAKILITGAAGFIGSALALRLLGRGDKVLGIDNLNDYYEVSLKKARLARLEAHPGFQFRLLDIVDREGMRNCFAGERFDAVVHLAAQAGVRYSIENPAAYIDANLVGFGNILEGVRQGKSGHLVFASSSSVYGSKEKLPFSEADNVDHPISLYAATKKANELMAHCYAHLYDIPCTGLRFFTVYGPWGRPDMAFFKFTRAIIAGKPIPVFNHGDMLRDFTYVDDIVEGIICAMEHQAVPDTNWRAEDPDPGTSSAPYRIYNIGNGVPVKLMRYIEVLEQSIGKKAICEMLPMQPGDVPATGADVSRLERDVGYRPTTPVEIGVKRFVEWYREYYKV